MRIRVIRKPTEACIDGIRLDIFEPGLMYEVGHLLGALMLAERWAEPVASDDPAVVIPIGEFHSDPRVPANLAREDVPPYYDEPFRFERRRRRRSASAVN